MWNRNENEQTASRIDYRNGMCPRVEDEIASQNASSEIPTAIATKDARNRQIQSQINSCRIGKGEEME